MAPFAGSKRRSIQVAGVSALVAMALLAGGCSSRTTPDASQSPSAGLAKGLEVDPSSAFGLPKPLGLEPIVRPETVVLDAKDSPVDSAIILNERECLPTDPERVPCDFRLTFASAPSGITVGSVLASDVTKALPNGLLVKVTKVDGGTVLATEAALGDALEQGEFLVEKQFTAADIRGMALAPGVTATGETALAAAKVGGVGSQAPLPAPELATRVLRGVDAGRVATGDGVGLGFNFEMTNVALADGVVANGHVGFDVGCGSYGGLTWKKYLGVPVYPNGVHFEAKCGATQDSSITVTATAGATLDESVTIATVPLDAITFFVGPVPIVLIPTITVTANASGQVSAGMSFGAAEHFGAQVGIRYNKGFSLIKDFSYGFDTTVSDVTTRATAQAGVNLGEALMLYGLAGPQLNELIYAKLEGKPPGERPIWCLKGGIEASVSLHIDLGIKELNFGPEKLFGDETELACAQNVAPTVTIQGGDQGFLVYPASAFQPPLVVAYSNDVEEGALPISWAADGKVLGTSKSGEKFSLSTLSIGTHTVTASSTDGDGATASASTTVVAKEATPTAQILVQNGSGQWVDASTASGTTGGELVVRVVSYSPLGISVGDCMPTTWSGGLPVSSAGGCDNIVSLSTAGSFPLAATATDPDGKTVTDSITVTVTNPAPGSPPSFTLVSGVNTSVSPNQALCDGCTLGYGDQARLATSYTNSAQAGKAVAYVWEYTTKSAYGTSAWKTLSGADVNPATGSSRNFSAPSEYRNSYTYTFRVTVKDASTSAPYFSDTFVLTYQGPPA